MEDDMLILLSYIRISSYREKIVMDLKKSDNIPTVIARNTGIRVNHISKVLSELKTKGIVYCINDDAKKNRVYSLTDLGMEISSHLNA